MADISIIVPIYNAEKFIKKCVDSLLNQTKKELEFILINDGSTDKTHDILKIKIKELVKQETLVLKKQQENILSLLIVMIILNQQHVKNYIIKLLKKKPT